MRDKRTPKDVCGEATQLAVCLLYAGWCFGLWFVKQQMSLKHTKRNRQCSLRRLKNLLITNFVLFH